MEVRQDVDLDSHSTMGVGGRARFFATVRNAGDVHCAFVWAAERGVAVAVTGGGSNIIWSDGGFDGLVLKNQIRGCRVIQCGDGISRVFAGSGEQLDDVVEKLVRLGLTGTECLSKIPGTLGGAVVQNSGAYGQDISQSLIDVEVYDKIAGGTATLSKAACCLGYRTSIFKGDQSDRYTILGLTMELKTGDLRHITHPRLVQELGGCGPQSPALVRMAISEIRKSKLPDTAVVPNCGSFFTNPLLQMEANRVEPPNDNIPHLVAGDGYIRVPAAWLIEQCGLKDHFDEGRGCGTWTGQPLVVYTKRKTSSKSIREFGDVIGRAVYEKFGILLELEPVVMGI